MTPVRLSTDTLEQREQPATSVVLGLRYLTSGNATFVADYFRNGAGYASEEIGSYFELIERGTTRSPGPVTIGS